jgi:hypothetical protein
MDIASVRAIADRALADGKLTAAEHDEIEAAILADGVVTAEEMELLESIAEQVRQGRIELIGPDGRPV